MFVKVTFHPSVNAGIFAGATVSRILPELKYTEQFVTQCVQRAADRVLTKSEWDRAARDYYYNWANRTDPLSPSLTEQEHRAYQQTIKFFEKSDEPQGVDNMLPWIPLRIGDLLGVSPQDVVHEFNSHDLPIETFLGKTATEMRVAFLGARAEAADRVAAPEVHFGPTQLAFFEKKIQREDLIIR
jgi:hypothetical protein